MRLLPSAFLVAFCLASFGAHWSVVSWALRAFPSLEARRRGLRVGAAVVVAMAPISRALAHGSRTAWSSGLWAFAVSEVTLVVLLALPTLLLHLVLSLARAPVRAQHADARDQATPVVSPKGEKREEPERLGRRRLIERASGLAALGVAGSAFGWGMLRGRHLFTIEEVVVKIVGLPRALEGYTIAQISDLHTGVFVQERELSEGLARVAECSPDLVVATGDLVDFDASFAPLVARRLADLEARDGVVAIVGNHDHYAGIGAVLSALRGAGVEVLLNQGKRIRPQDGGGFALLGVDDIQGLATGGAGPDLDAALAMVPADAPRILLAHRPELLNLTAGRVALQLSGHTHGGQINPGFSPVKLLLPYVAGRYDLRGTTLWVNRGFGVGGPPARIGAPPEVTKIILVGA